MLSQVHGVVKDSADYQDVAMAMADEEVARTADLGFSLSCPAISSPGPTGSLPQA